MAVTIVIIALTCLVSFPAFNNEKMREDLLYWPYMINKKNQWYRFLTGGFLHADAVHLIFNMVSLYSFGNALEKFYFPKEFGDSTSIMLYIILYLTAIIVACVPDYFKNREHYEYRALGASGAVSAIIFAVIIIEPAMPIRFFFIPIDIPGWVFGLLFLGLSAYLARKGGGNIGHNAHFWGGIYGILFTWLAVKAYTQEDLFKSFLEKIF